MIMFRHTACAIALALTPATGFAQSEAALWKGFVDPPAEARPMMRWWWFGPSVEKGEIDREIRAMKAGGFGGFEVQPTYPLSPDDAPKGLKNLPYLSDEFIAALRHAGRTARAEGMRIDVTGGSGWPFGGPHIPVTQAAASIRMERRAVPAGATELILPAAGPGERVISAMIGPVRKAESADRPLTPIAIGGPRATFSASGEAREALVFIAGRTAQQVKRPSIGAEGYVLDHIDPTAVSNHLKTVGDRLLEAFDRSAPPYAIFSDSLEAYGSSWTGDLPAEFRRRRGYELTAHLPSLFLDIPRSAAVRYDWARTLSELVDERYLKPIDAWAKARGTRFRAQVYGFPPPTLSSNGLVALPEGEGADWRNFNSTRWATSGAHLYGKPVVSSEVWTWLHSPSWAATPLDMKMEADRHFLQGVTQLVGHGWPYTPPGVAEPGWAFYAAAALNDHNPWWGVMPDLARYLQRVSHMLRQGEPANAVAVYLPTEDAFADMRPEKASVNEEMRERVPASLLAQIIDGGHGFDFIDAQAIRARGIRHRVLVLPPMTRIDAAAYRTIADWVAKGGRVVTVGKAPSAAGGLLDETRETAIVQSVARQLGRQRGAVLVREGGLGAALAAAVTPDVRLAKPDPAIGHIHRRVDGGDVYFVVNTGNRAVETSARFVGDRGNGMWWNPVDGTRAAAGSGDIRIRLAPYESRLLVFSGPTLPAPSPAPAGQSRRLGGWSFALPGAGERPLPALTSWADDAAGRYVSGTATYRQTLRIDRQPGTCLALDFGDAAPVAEKPRQRLRASIAAPVRDAAVVFVNGERAGSLWSAPYRLDITRFAQSGENRIEVQVSNTMMNALAGRAAPDYRLLHSRYGERFQPQDTADIAPAPSGLIGTVSLVTTPGC